MTTIVKTETEKAGAFRQVLHFDRGGHTLFADTSKEAGGTATAPGPHDLFDASLAACKAFTAHSYAKLKGFPLERVTATIDRDDSKEKEGHYALTVTLELLGPLTAEQRERLLDVVSRCPVHKLMTTTEISITTKVA
jgi:putative redox protein